MSLDQLIELQATLNAQEQLAEEARNARDAEIRRLRANRVVVADIMAAAQISRRTVYRAEQREKEATQ